MDDDDSVRDAISEYLSHRGYRIEKARDGIEAVSLLERQDFALIVLDIMMPGEDGLSICERIAQDSPPILLLSALGSTKARILGLDSGAADYLPKPFEPRELLARVRAILRRDKTGGHICNTKAFQFCDLTYRPADAVLLKNNGAIVALTAGDIRLLETFLARPTRLLSRDALISAMHHARAEPYERAIDLAVSRLRGKLARAGANEVIETVRGIGYRMKARVDRL